MTSGAYASFHSWSKQDGMGARKEFFSRVFSLLLVLLQLVCCCRATEVTLAAANCRDEYLIAVANTSLGMDVAVLHKERTTDKPYQQLDTIAVTVDDHYLSPECGSHYSRCKDLLVVETKSAEQHIVLIPILNGILLLDLRYNGWEISLTDYQTIDIAFGCSPTAIYKISSSIFTICLNLERNYLTLLEIDVDVTSIKDTEITNPLLKFNELRDPPRLSNFVLVNLDTDTESQLIYFSTAGHMYTIIPFSYIYSYSGKLAFCTQVDEMVQADQWTLIAYCNDNSTVYYDMFYNDWINQTEYTEIGKPYVCPNNPDMHLAVYPASYIQYGFWSQNSAANSDVPGMKFETGVCFGSKNNSLFAYKDRDAGEFVFEVSSSTHTPLSSKPCRDPHCEPLTVFDDRYVVIREKDTIDASVTVVDSQQNYSKIITALHTQADLLTLIVEEPVSPLACDSNYKAVSTPTESPPSLGENDAQLTIVGASIGIFVLFLAAGVIAGIAIIVRCYKRRSKANIPIEETNRQAESMKVLHNAYDTSRLREQWSTDIAHAEAGGPGFLNLPKPNHVYPEQEMPQGIPQISQTKMKTAVESSPPADTTNGRESAIPKKKGQHATSHKPVKKRRPSRDSRHWDYEHLQLQSVQDDEHKE